jgi:hypothetical protein
MRYLPLFLILGLFAAWAADADRQKSDYRLRLERPSDGHGNSVFALDISPGTRSVCDVTGAAVANYLFVNNKTGERRWLFPQPQRCIWRVLYFAHRPQTRTIEPADARAVVYDVTPSADLDTWGVDEGTPGFRFCMGTNPCLPLRRIFVSQADGRNLTPLTPTFQILDPIGEVASITQRQDGMIVVSPPRGDRVEFSINASETR